MMMMMLKLMRNFGLLILVGALGACASKKKIDDSTAAPTDADAAISNQNLDMNPQGSDSGKISGLNTIYFEYDQARLNSEARRILADNASWLKRHTGVAVQVEGHTDARGSVEYNLALGERRARAVKAYLSSLGIDGRSLTIISYGKEKPLVSGDNEQAFSKNRRANFIPLGK